MKKYSELTDHGKKLRLRKVAELALEQYELQIERITFFTEATNMLYKLVDTSGKRYMMKVFTDDYTDIEDNKCEVYMLDVVKRNYDGVVPGVVHTKGGDGIVTIDSKYTERPFTVIVYDWTLGSELDGQETYEHFNELGAKTAKLHMATEGVEVPKELRFKVLNNVFYFKDEVAVYKAKEYQKFLSKDYHHLMDTLIPYVNDYLKDKFVKPGIQMVHGDINPWNVLVNGDELEVIDYDDAALGYAYQDLAIMLFYYRFSEELDYKKIKDNYFAGYESIKPLPEFSERDLEMVMLARRLNFMNYILEVSDDPKDYIDRSVKRVKETLKCLELEI